MIVDNGRHYLYRHIRLDKNQPFYIGVGSKRIKNNFKTFKSEYHRAFVKEKRNSIWRLITKKTPYVVEILVESNDREFILNKEKEAILLYGRIDLKTGILCNQSCGGEDGEAFNDIKKKKKRVTWNAKKSFLYDGVNGNFIASFSLLQDLCKFTGIKDNRVGLICKNNFLFNGYIYSFEYLGGSVDISKFKKRVTNGVSNIVYKIDIYSGEIVGKFKNCTDAAKSMKIRSSAVGAAINKKSNCNGFYWSYSDKFDITEFKTGFNEVCKLNMYGDVVCQYKSISEASKHELVSSASISYAIKNMGTCNGHRFVLYKNLHKVNINDFKKPLKTAVIRVCYESKEEKIYEKLTDAAKEINVNNGRICEAIKNNKILNGYQWQYLN